MDNLSIALALAEEAEGVSGNVMTERDRVVLAALAQARATVAAAAQLERIADVLEQVAPASTNGQGDVVARAFEVAAALRADGT